MKGIVFQGSRELSIVQIADPTPGPGEVVLEMKASGMCGSDLKFYRSSRDEALAALGFKSVEELGIDPNEGIVAGHEPCGVIAAVGPDVDPREFKVGDRVMVHHYDGCHLCDLCRSGWPQMCDYGALIYGVTRHGGHAEYMKVPASTLVHLPEELSYATGAAIACGTGTAYGALVRMALSARDTLVVVGLGPVGQSAVQIGAAMGARVIGVDVTESRIRDALALGAAEGINSSRLDAVGEILRLTGGKGASCTLDASGSSAGRETAVRAASKWGRAVFVGEGGEVTLQVSRDMIRKQLSLFGSYTFSLKDQGECARFLANKGVEVDKIFTDRWRLDDADQAYKEFDKQAGGKAVFLM